MEYNWQTWNAKRIIDVKKQILLTNAKCFSFQLYTSWALLFCKTLKDFGINKEKEIFLPNKECIRGHICERTNMAATYEIFMDYSKNNIGIF